MWTVDVVVDVERFFLSKRGLAGDSRFAKGGKNLESLDSIDPFYIKNDLAPTRRRIEIEKHL